MEKLTKYMIIGIGILSILSGVYRIFSKGELNEILFSIFIGVSLIGTYYFENNRKLREKV